MSLLLDWFKSEKQKELDRLKIEEQKLKNEYRRADLERLKAGIHPTVTEQTTIPPDAHLPVCKSIKLAGNVLTVVLNDGAVLSKIDATYEDFSTARGTCNEQELIQLMISNAGKAEARRITSETQKVKATIDGMQKLAQLKDFELKGNSLYLKGTSRSIPQLLIDEFAECVGIYDDVPTPERLEECLQNDDRYQALKNFFLWCCLNPRAEVANELYEFLKRNSFRITKQGFFVALRNVVRLPGNENSELVDFISNAYNKIKAVWKKKPEEFIVVQDEDLYTLQKADVKSPNGTVIGNLQTLYLDLPNMAGNRFTDNYTRTFDIRVGQPVRMDPKDCKWTTQDCAAAGLHFTADEIHYVGCGDTSVLILINPMKVVGIGSAKGRCYEYLPIMTVPREEATEILHDLDFDTLELDEDYAISELETLAEQVKKGFAAETTKYEFNLPNISTAEIGNIVKSLEDMKKILSKRVSVIK